MATKYWYNAVPGTYTWSVVGNWYLGSGGTGGSTTLPSATDDVILDAASGASVINITTTAQVRSIVATTFTGEITGTTNIQVVGSNTGNQGSGKSIEWGTGMTYSYIGTYTITATNGSGSINFNGKTHGAGNITFNAGTTLAPTASWSLLNDLTAGGNILLTAGTLTTNNYNITCARFDLSNNAFTKVLNFGTSVITLNIAGGTFWANQSTGGAAINGTYTIRYNGIGSSTISFLGGSATYYIVEFIRGSSTVQLNVTGDNTFYDFIDVASTAAHTISFTSGSTQTFQNFNVRGSSGLARITLARSATLVVNLIKIGVGFVYADYLNLSVNTTSVTPAFTWYAGYNSIGTGAGWVFRNPTGLLAMGVGG